RMLQRLVAVRLVADRGTAGAGGLGPGRLVPGGMVAAAVSLLPALRPGRGVGGRSLVVPGDRVVGTLLRVEAGEQPVKVLGVAEVLVDDPGRARVVHDV